MICSLPPRPFWKMSIEELKKYSQQMVKYDQEQINFTIYKPQNSITI